MGKVLLFLCDVSLDAEQFIVASLHLLLCVRRRLLATLGVSHGLSGLFAMRLAVEREGASCGVV